MSPAVTYRRHRPPNDSDLCLASLAADFFFGPIHISFMASNGIHRGILRRAAEVVGGEDKLAQHLDVGSDQMHEWIQGKATASGGVYLIALDILSRSSSAPEPKKSPERVQSCGALISSAGGRSEMGKLYETFE